MNQQLAIETINRLRDERDALRRKLEQAEGERVYLVAEYEQLRDENRRLREAMNGGEGAQPQAMSVNLRFIGGMLDLMSGGSSGFSARQAAHLLIRYADTIEQALAQPAPAPARYQCERCGGTGVQPQGRHWDGSKYAETPSQPCQLCGGEGKLGTIPSQPAQQPEAALAASKGEVRK